MAYLSQLRKFRWYKGRDEYQYRVPESPDSSPRDESLEKRSEDGLLDDLRDHAFPKHRALWQNGRVMIIAHVLLLTVYAAGLAAVWKAKTTNLRREGHNAIREANKKADGPIAPAANILEWKDTVFTLEDRITDRGSFVGKPSPEVDKAWHDLLNDENIMVEPEYIKHYGREDISVRIPEGDGYIGTLNVYHQIHCLKRIRQFMYQDYYFADSSKEDIEMNRLHNEHCIDFLRQSAMCHGDVGLLTFEWHASSRLPLANATSHQCVNWEKLDQWTKARTVDMMKPGWLVHPTLGVAYPSGEGDKIGAAHGHMDN
ncbi:hypothetical protein FQN55_007439 [Onygenales sp. PD_40]|nr:hypothetical protein FQN55_007439 [Onygenales sp. PD_40]